ncbi:cytochrome P450 [Massarina eburnea CBS 473.64]|uniref:Cytochrome P450 n=1 Tax=Massarina eburnea CBS 473.64 TaxID=1395130 RepID=A0A6A6RPC5_9PLEO|nr:cytochrome P450 [Massarina eburnea CBS 473.64]
MLKTVYSDAADNASIYQQIPKLLFLFCTAISFYWLLPFLHGLFIAPTRNVPGPLLARLTRWFEYRVVQKGDSHQEYIRLHQKHGSVVRVGPNRYSFSDPTAVKTIYELGSKFLKSDYYNPILHPVPALQNIFAMRDPELHKARRRKVANLYTMSTMVSYEPAVDKLNRVCLRKLREFAAEDRVVDIPQFIQYYAFDVIGEITLNHSFSMMENTHDPTGMIADIKIGLNTLALNGLIPSLIPLSLLSARLFGSHNALHVLSTLTRDVVDKNRASNAKQNVIGPASFLQKLLQMEGEGRVDMSNIMDATGSNVRAGSDTTAITLSSALYYLYTNETALGALRTEIEMLEREGRLSDPVTWSEAQSMPFLQAVLKESLRMHPAVGAMLPRVVPKGGVRLAGTYFPEGTQVGANAWAVHYNKDIYGPDADEFKPERWLGVKDGGGDVRDSMMMAFGAGSRTCIGKNISLLEMTKVIPQIVRNFDIVPDGDDGVMKTHTKWFVFTKWNARLKIRGGT